MPKIQYKQCNFHASSLIIIKQANNIISEYQSKGFSLTLRQLFYQFVARDLLKNTQKNYKKLGAIVSDARLDGRIDWNAIVDRTRFIRRLNHFDSPADIIAACQSSYHIDMWKNQPYRPEVWIEKDALVGVFERTCNQYDVPLFSCRGYTSQSEMWGASQRLHNWIYGKQIPVILHFGDHDPSGLDMTRDITDRLEMFIGTGPIERLALNMNQVKKYKPPPNPAKISDPRAKWYIEEYDTTNSWELDALDPERLAALVTERITKLIDYDQWVKDEKYAKQGRKELELISANHEKVAKFVSKLNKK